MIRQPVCIYCKRGIQPIYVVDLPAAEYLVGIGIGKLNARRTKLNLPWERGDPAIAFMDGDPDRFPRFHRAQSLTIGPRVMDKAAVEDSFYHQKIAEAWRSRDLSFPKQQTRAVNAGIAERKVDADPTKVATESAYSL